MRSLSLLGAAATALLLAAPGLAQSGAYTFDVDPAASNFNFSGDSSVGTIKGRPPTFAMDGTLEMDLTYGGGGYLSGKFNGGVLFTVPSRITAEIPNVFSWLPPLATIYIDDAEYSATSSSFAVNPAGDFTTDLVMTPIGGTITIIPLVGSTTVDNLANYGATDPTPVSGNVVPDFQGGAIFNMPVDVSFYSDDGQGNWVQLDLNGVLDATAAGVNGMMLTDNGPVFAGSPTTLDVANATPGAPTFLAYGLAQGATPVPPLGITLDLANAKQLGGTVIANGQGEASWTVPVPPNAAGIQAFLQACQAGEVSNVLAVTIL